MAQTEQQPAVTRARTGTTLAVPTGTRMLLTLPGVFDNIPTDLVGIVQGEYLILKMPMVPGIRARLGQGEPVTIRYLCGGVIYGFGTSVITFISRPGFLVFLAFPDVVEQLELRQHRRVNCLLPCALHVPGCILSGIMLDVSLGGCRVALDPGCDMTPEALAAHDMVVLHLPTLIETENTVLSCHVKAANLVSGRIHAGLQFFDLDEGARGALFAYLEAVSCLI